MGGSLFLRRMFLGRSFFLLCIALSVSICSSAQAGMDSLSGQRSDTAFQRADSLIRPVVLPAVAQYSYTDVWDSLRVVVPGSVLVVRDLSRVEGEVHQADGKDALFYSLLGMVLLLALFRRAFPKYWSDLFRLFFRTTLRQRQLRDQLELASLPSLLLNVFFFICLAFYFSLFLSERGWNPFGEYWQLWLLLLGGLVVMYVVKWLGLRFAAWVFGQSAIGEDYTFLVFTVNKMMGLLLLPAVIGLAFTDGRLWEWSLVLSWVLIGGLLLYRGYLTYRVVRRQASLSPFHFLLYWLGFELAPLMILYRFLFGFFR